MGYDHSNLLIKFHINYFNQTINTTVSYIIISFNFIIALYHILSRAGPRTPYFYIPIN
jgi:hypothetical protein